jgi:hypothetical protein
MEQTILRPGQTVPDPDHVPDDTWVLLDRDPLTGVEDWFCYHSDTDTYTIQQRQDVGRLLELTKAEATHAERNTRYGDGMAKVASIPLNIFFDPSRPLHKDPAALKRFLNDRDHQQFRTRPGKV